MTPLEYPACGGSPFSQRQGQTVLHVAPNGLDVALKVTPPEEFALNDGEAEASRCCKSVITIDHSAVVRSYE
jgi:hypothetical protein